MIKKILKKIRYELQFNNPHYYTRISEKILKKSCRRRLQKKLHSLPPITLNSQNAQLTVAMLANKENFYESVAALYSFCFWYKDVVLHYHEDGTLSENEFAFLREKFPGIVIFMRSGQNVQIRKYLLSKGLKCCSKLREHFIFSIRMFDMLIEKNTRYLLQIDSDVLFFSKPDELLDILINKNLNSCYNRDLPNSSYTFKRDIIARYVSVPMVEKFNAGLFMHNFDEDFFIYTETILENEPQGAESWHLEQTLFAMYASCQGKYLELPKQYDLGRRERNLGNKIISEHYVHNTGYDQHKDFIYKLCPIYHSKK